MELLFIIIAGLILLFGLTLIFGAPFLPTLTSQTEVALDLLDLKKGQHLLELGSGDGRIMLAAAKRGIRSTGYEINPLLVWYSRIRLMPYRKIARVKNSNYMFATWPEADGIYMFSAQKYLSKLKKKITNSNTKPIRVVSFGYKFSDTNITKSKSGMHLYLFSKNK